MAIIGCSGKINSGKDTIGTIIQYLTSSNYEEVKNILKERNNREITIQEHFNSFIQRKQLCNWQIHKFADALKDIVCILTGCTREQLEDEEFKNSKLPDEWNYKEGSDVYEGKVKIYNVFDKPKCITFGGNNPIEKYTYREFMQILGTEAGRNIIHPNIWVNALFNKYRCFPNFIITDVRFPNEFGAIKSRNGIVIRINRFPKEIYINNELRIFDKGSEIHLKKLNKNQHISETALDNHKFDYTIENNGTIEELIIKVKEILTNEEII